MDGPDQEDLGGGSRGFPAQEAHGQDLALVHDNGVAWRHQPREIVEAKVLEPFPPAIDDQEPALLPAWGRVFGNELGGQVIVEVGNLCSSFAA
jgi:hypothetical protein